MKTVIAFAFALVISVPAMAQPPVNGTWKSTDLGGPVLTGLYSEFFPTGTRLTVNNTLNEQSWDGATFGTQWQWYCPWVAAPPTLLLNTVNGSGNGIRIWRVDYIDGVCWLSGAGPWGGGDPSYTASIDTWTEIVTDTYASNVLVGSVRTASATGTFSGFNEECMNLTLSNKEMHGTGSPLPAGYPVFWFWTPCASVGTSGTGEWGEVDDITFTVQGCETVPVQEKNWGQVKALYGE